MACNAAGLVDKETPGAPKLDELEDILTEICLQSGLKAVVFSQWERMTQLVEARLKRMGLGSVRLHGGVPTNQRGQLMDRFREDDSVQVFIATDAGGVGLNLQNAAALINLDVPWNPAVLEQRNARIHRLGQTRTVQIITMIAADSYEEQVFALVRNKQNLFDNVISEDATEDVVGVSKKLLETLVENLIGGSEPTEEKEPAQTDPAPMSESHSPSPVTGLEVEQAIHRCIEQLQQTFGRRIERIFGSGGGLVVVLDKVDAEADQIAEQASGEVPVALLDRLTLRGLQRLGNLSPVAETRDYYDATTDHTSSSESAMQRQAREKLTAARMLLDQNLLGSAMELILAALLTAAADKAGRPTALERTEFGIWAYAEALPGGILDHEQVGLVMRALSFAQGGEPPAALISALLDEAAPFVGV
jgi:hypothetical protein